jgi:hypothetical protein
MIAEEVPYAYVDSIDLSNVDLSIDLSNNLSDLSINLIPISVEIVPHKAYLIDEPQSHSQSTNGHGHSYLNYQIFRSENRINRDRDILIETDRSRINHQILIQRIKCIFYTLISIPITIILLGYVSMTWERASR